MLLFFNATVTTQIYTLSLHDALPISEIKTFFTRKNSCEHIFDYDYRILRNERTVRVVMSQINDQPDRKSTRLNSSHVAISYAVFCLKKKKKHKKMIKGKNSVTIEKR